MSLRLVIVADDPVAAAGMRRAFASVAGCTVLADVPYGRPDAMPTGPAAPDVILLDGGCRSAHGLARVPGVRAAAPRSTVVAVAGDPDGAWLHAAGAAGIDAVVSPDVQPAVLVTLVREIAAGRVYHPAVRAARSDRRPATTRSPLTARELEILRLVADGASNAHIATRLWVTEQTVKFHLSNVYRKLGVANRTQASRYAHVHGLMAVGQDIGRAAVPEAA